jgi:hypothetical protein
VRESSGVDRPGGAMKVNSARVVRGARRREDGARVSAGARIPEAFREMPPLRLSRRTESAHAGTRKMVNYAWSGRSQGKP